MSPPIGNKLSQWYNKYSVREEEQLYNERFGKPASFNTNMPLEGHALSKTWSPNILSPNLNDTRVNNKGSIKHNHQYLSFNGKENLNTVQNFHNQKGIKKGVTLRTGEKNNRPNKDLEYDHVIKCLTSASKSSSLKSAKSNTSNKDLMMTKE